jgi:hypothetical protein
VLQHTDPPIWRQVEVPTLITLKVLHDIIKAVMTGSIATSGSTPSPAELWTADG